jgi:Straboviridae intron-associated endonuclease 1
MGSQDIDVIALPVKPHRDRSDPGVYCIRNRVTGKVYVGSASQVGIRFRTHVFHLRRGKHHSIKLQRSWNKHGEGVFEFVRLEKCDKKDLITREQFYIESYNSFRNGYNCQPNATSSGRESSAETRAKIRDIVKAAMTPEESRRRQAVAKENRDKDPNWGARHSAAAKSIWTPEYRKFRSDLGKKIHRERPELRERIRVARTGSKPSDETRKKMSAKRTGRKASAAHREAIRNGLKGHTVSEETREKIRIANKGWKPTDEQRERHKVSLQLARDAGKFDHRRPSVFSAEARAKISAAHKGKKKSPETVSKMRDAARRRWSKRKNDPNQMVLL